MDLKFSQHQSFAVGLGLRRRRRCGFPWEGRGWIGERHAQTLLQKLLRADELWDVEPSWIILWKKNMCKRNHKISSSLPFDLPLAAGGAAIYRSLEAARTSWAAISPSLIDARRPWSRRKRSGNLLAFISGTATSTSPADTDLSHEMVPSKFFIHLTPASCTPRCQNSQLGW
jgi:hypothetical protein